MRKFFLTVCLMAVMCGAFCIKNAIAKEWSCSELSQRNPSSVILCKGSQWYQGQKINPQLQVQRGAGVKSNSLFGWLVTLPVLLILVAVISKMRNEGVRSDKSSFWLFLGPVGLILGSLLGGTIKVFSVLRKEEKKGKARMRARAEESSEESNRPTLVRNSSTSHEKTFEDNSVALSGDDDLDESSHQVLGVSEEEIKSVYQGNELPSEKVDTTKSEHMTKYKCDNCNNVFNSEQERNIQCPNCSWTSSVRKLEANVAPQMPTRGFSASATRSGVKRYFVCDFEDEKATIKKRYFQADDEKQIGEYLARKGCLLVGIEERRLSDSTPIDVSQDVFPPGGSSTEPAPSLITGTRPYDPDDMARHNRPKPVSHPFNEVNKVNEVDEILEEAIEIVIRKKHTSTSDLQRSLRLGYSRAARVMKQMEMLGIIGSAQSDGSYVVLISKESWRQNKKEWLSGGYSPKGARAKYESEQAAEKAELNARFESSDMAQHNIPPIQESNFQGEVGTGMNLPTYHTGVSVGQVSDEQFRKNYLSNNMMPKAFDVSMEGWLMRIEYWGTKTVTHHNPVTGMKEAISDREFLDMFGNASNRNKYGDWKIEHLDLSKITFFRDAVDSQGNKKVEKLVVSIKLRPELQKTIKWWKVLNPFI